MKTFKNLLAWKQKSLTLDIWYVASSSKPLTSLFKVCPWEHNGPAWGHIFIKAYIGKTCQIILSETTRPRALVFGL